MTVFVNIVVGAAVVVLALLGLVCVLAMAHVSVRERRDGMR